MNFNSFKRTFNPRVICNSSLSKEGKSLCKLIASNYNQTGIAFLVGTPIAFFFQRGNVRENVVSLFLVVSWYSKEIFKQFRASLENAMKRLPRFFLSFFFSSFVSRTLPRANARREKRTLRFVTLPIRFFHYPLQAENRYARNGILVSSRGKLNARGRSSCMLIDWMLRLLIFFQ